MLLVLSYGDLTFTELSVEMQSSLKEYNEVFGKRKFEG